MKKTFRCKLVVLSAVILFVSAWACGETSGSGDDSTDSQTETDGSVSSVGDDSENETDSNSDSDSDSDRGADSGVDDGCISSSDRFDGSLFGQMDAGFFVKIYEDLGSLEGGVLSGPRLSFHTEIERVGECRLLVYEGDTCEEDCMRYGLQCFDGECVDDDATYVDSGDIRLRDATGLDRTISPSDIFSYYYQTGELARSSNEWVSLDLEIDGQSVSLRACVPAPLDPNPSLDDASAAWQPGEDLVLTWDTVESNSRIYLYMTTGIGTHGGISPVEIECEGPDHGELTIPAAFLSALDCEPYCWSCGECGYHYLIRYHTDQTEVGGKIVRLNNQTQSGFMFRPDMM